MAAFGKLGESVTSLERSEFFSWFSFKKHGEGSYRPSGEAFADLVWLVADTDKGGPLERVALGIARSFIDDDRQGAFARDLVKSFLSDVAGSDRELLAPLIEEIFHRDPPHPVMMGGPRPELPSTPSPGYLAFIGAGPAWSRGLPQVRLSLEERDADGAGQLLIAAERVARPKGWLARMLGR